MKGFKRVFLIAIGLYLSISTMLYFLQEKLIFLPSRLPQEYVYQFDHPHEELFVTTPDGARLNAVHFKAENPKGLILYFHGNAGDLSRWGEVTSFFVQYQYDVLVMDYRTYGKSTGKLGEQALYDDAQLFYNHVLDRFAEGDIIVYGRSLGTTFATYLASKNNPGKLILETPFNSLVDVAQQHYPFLPIRRLLKYQFPTQEFAPEVGCSVTIIHGTSDSVVPYENGQKLFRAFNAGNEFITIEEGEHNNLIEFRDYHLAIEAILN